MDLSKYAQQLHGRGAVPPSAEKLASLPEHQHVIAVEALPDAVDLSALAGPPNDQGDEGSCVGEATAKAVGVAYAVKSGQVVALSPAFAYYEARVLEGTTSQDAGSDPTDALTQVQKIGICTEAEMPYVAGQFATAPTPQQVADAAAYKIDSFHTCSTAQSIMQALATKMAVLVTIGASDAFESTPASGIVPQSSLDDLPHDWDHEQTFVGYNQSAAPLLGIPAGMFKLVNSWGKSWGDGGYYFVPIARFDYFYGPIVPVLAAAPAPTPTPTPQPAATTTQLTASSNPIKAGQFVTISATVTGNQPTGSVTFTDNGLAIASVQLTSGQAQTTPSPWMTAGSHTLVATFSGDANNAPSFSAPLTLTVTAPFVPNQLFVSDLQWCGAEVVKASTAYQAGDTATTIADLQAASTYLAALANWLAGTAARPARPGR